MTAQENRPDLSGFYLTHIADDYAKNSFKKWKEY